MELKKFRQKINISQYELADKIGMSRSTLSNYEKNLAEPSISTLIKLADFFNITIDELVGRKTDILNLNFVDDTRKRLIKNILNVSDNLVEKLEALFEGMKLAENERQETIKKIKGRFDNE